MKNIAEIRIHFVWNIKVSNGIYVETYANHGKQKGFNWSFRVQNIIVSTHSTC